MIEETDAATITFRWTRSELFWIIFRRNIRKLWYWLLVPTFATIWIVMAFVAPNAGDTNLSTDLSSAYVSLAVGVVLFGWTPFFTARMLMKSPNASGPITLTASRQGIELTGTHSNTRIDWAMIKGVAETKAAILISLNPIGFQIVPKRHLTTTELAAFRGVLRAHAPDGAKLPKD